MQQWEAAAGGRESVTPTFHFCVSDDPLNSSGGIKENDVSIIKVHCSADWIVGVPADHKKLAVLVSGTCVARGKRVTVTSYFPQ